MFFTNKMSLLKHNISFRVQLLFYTMLTVLLVALIFTIFMVQMQSTRALDADAKQVNQAIKTLSKTIKNPLYQMDIKNLRGVLKNALSEPNLKFIVLLDNKGNFITNGTEDLGKNKNNSYKNFVQTKELLNIYDNNVHYIVNPIDFPGQGILGYLYAAYSLEAFKKQKEEQLNESLILLLSCFIFTSLISFFFSNKFSKPLRDLTEKAEKMEFGQEAALQKTNIKEINSLYLSLSRMLSKIKKRDLKLSQFNKSLEDTVKLRTVELERTLEQAEAANTAKSTFLANMSHELRTPLNAIIGYSSMLREDIKDMTPEEINQDLERINASGTHLLSLIQDILDVSKIEAGKMEVSMDDFNVIEMLE